MLFGSKRHTSATALQLKYVRLHASGEGSIVLPCVGVVVVMEEVVGLALVSASVVALVSAVLALVSAVLALVSPALALVSAVLAMVLVLPVLAM